MKKLYTLFALLISMPAAFGQAAIPVANAAATGTTLNSTAVINTSNAAVIAGTGNTGVPTLIVVGGAGTTGQAQLAVLGPASCTMDTTIASGAAGYFVVNSTTGAGDCHPPAAAPGGGVWVIGFLGATATTSGQTAIVNVQPFLYGSTTGAVS